MKNKGFTLVELLAVLVILSVVGMIVTPNVMVTRNNSNKKLYLVEAQDFVAKATYMYVQEQYLNNPSYFTKTGDNSYSINLGKIEGISDYKDPYGYEYDKEESTINFIEINNAEGFTTREVNIYIRSCDPKKPTKCHCISGNSQKISEDSVDGICKG